MTAMNSIAEGVALADATMAIPRFEDGFINMQELIRSLAESLVNEIMSAEADQLIIRAVDDHPHQTCDHPISYK